MNIIDELRREFPGWTIGLRAGGKTAKCWKHGDEPPASQVDDYALVSEADGVFLGTPLGDSEAQTFPTLLEAAEYALGEKAESTKAREMVNAEVPPDIRKDFTAKPRLTLIPAGVLARHLLPVLHDGAKKHGRDHWRKCSAREYAEAAASHLLAFLDGQDIDESGHHSLAHAMADCALALGTLDKDTTP